MKPTPRRRTTVSRKMALMELVDLQLISFFPRSEIVKEHRFHPKRLWRFDRAIPRLKIAVEMHGGIYTMAGAKKCPTCKRTPTGGHTRGKQFEKDREKVNTAAIMGWLVLELTEHNIRSGQSYEMIEKAIESRKQNLLGGN